MNSCARLASLAVLAAGFGLACLPAALAQEPAVSETEAPSIVSTPSLRELAATSRAPSLNILSNDNHLAHIFPTVRVHEQMAAANAATTAGPALTYHGGPIMPEVKIFSIFWVPSQLQSGATAVMSSAYRGILTNFAVDYIGHGISNNNTQYYQIASTVKSYVSGLPPTGNPAAGSNGGTYLDTAPYPASGCTDTATPGNCLTDAQIQAELQRVMALKGWTGGLDRIYLIYTAQGEGSCFDSSSTQCAYTYYCAYHSYIGTTTPNIIYGNEPYGDPAYCQSSGTPSPHSNAEADTATTAASHEVTEAVTDPLLSAWHDATGSEIGDLCAYQYGTNTYASGKANQLWNGRAYELQTEYDNHVAGCVQVGP